MVTTAATSAFFPIPSPDSSLKPEKIGNGSRSFSFMKPKSGTNSRIHIKANAHAPPKINGSLVGLKSSSVKTQDDTPGPPPRTFINQLPDWSMLLAAITTVFLAAEKQWMMLDWKPKRPDVLVDPFGLGKIVQDGLIFRQNFSIRSYEIGADRTASIETLMNHLQVLMLILFYLCFHWKCYPAVAKSILGNGKHFVHFYRKWNLSPHNSMSLFTSMHQVEDPSALTFNSISF